MEINKSEAENKIAKLEIEIDRHEYYLSHGGMSNPMKIRRRERDLRNAKAEVKRLRKEFEIN